MVVAAAAVWLMCASARAQDVHVTILDSLGAGQEDESVAIFSGGRLLGSFRLGPEQPADSFEAVVPGGVLDYALCGHMRRREADGRVSDHLINSGGRVAVRPGDTVRLFTYYDVVFTMQTESEIPDVTPGPVCDAVVS